MHPAKVEVCLTPASFSAYDNPDAVVVIVDILRATSAICTAFMHGVKRIIPVRTLDEAREYKAKGFLVAAERDGIKKEFADFGNSPFNFSKDRIVGREVVYSTTNGTDTIMMAKGSHKVLIGAYLNHQAVVDYVLREKHDVLIICAGWKFKFNIEDTLYAGALAEAILKDANFSTICDSTYAAIDLWNIAKNDLMAYLEKAAQRHRLKKNKLDDVLDYCHTFNLTDTIPVLEDYYLVPLVTKV